MSAKSCWMRCGAWVCVWICGAAGSAAADPPGAANTCRPELRIDPLLLAQAEAVWELVARDDNPLWPGWNASDTPLLIYIPGEQDVLINHPSPPEGFAPLPGPARFLGRQLLVKNGPTLIEWDGQNTSREIGGVQTLVVADTLSNRKQWLRGILGDSRDDEQILSDLAYADFAANPYDQLALVAHEAFHVYQARQAPDKGADERDVRVYPCLSVKNNVGFALEGAALTECLTASDASAARQAALRWLAVRQDRRRDLPAKALAYEDGNEFSEGLAMYIEWRLADVLTGRTPAEKLWLAQGFCGFDDLGFMRAKRLQRLRQNMRGEVNVNNDPYGTSPLRGRLYFSGMAIAAMLDRFAPDWKEQVFGADVTLTGLAEQALKASPEELVSALAAARQAPDYDELVQAKTKLEAEGRADTERMVRAITEGPGTRLRVDFAELSSPRMGLSFTGYGVRMIDEQRTIYTLVPIELVVQSQAYGFSQTQPLATLEDRAARSFEFPLVEDVSPEQLATRLRAFEQEGGVIQDLNLTLPGCAVRAARARVSHDGAAIRVSFLPEG